MLLELFQKESDQIASKIESIQKQLSTLPDNNLLCVKNGRYIKAFLSENGQKTYLAKKDAHLLPDLLKKKYLSALLSDLQQEQSALNAYLSKYQNYHSQVQKISSNPAYRKMFKKHLLPVSDDLAEWASQPYERYDAYPENLRHPCLSGNIVRSKSEAMIDQALFYHQLPYRYECKLSLADTTIYPDFTIMHPRTHQLVYWEHFGMMDHPQYANTAFRKLQVYNANHIIPSVNLITTYETSDHPLTMDKIEKLIQYHLL